MTADPEEPKIRVVCTDCHFERVVRKEGSRPAEVIVEHGSEAGHILTTEEVQPSRSGEVEPTG